MLDYTIKIKQLIDELKAACAAGGLSGDGGEYKIVTQSFLYKFLNDKFVFEVQQKTGRSIDAISDGKDYELAQMRVGLNFKREYLIENLFKRQNEEHFYGTFNDTLKAIAHENAETLSIKTDEKAKILLFDNELFSIVQDESKRNNLARAVINKLVQAKIDFAALLNQGYDFFATIFEYMIADYNANGGGSYAEYYTPRSVARLMAEILVENQDLRSIKILDPSAGSGTLLMSIAHKIGVEKCSIYSQDISQKSSKLLQLNLLLNNLGHSMNNVVQGNTITHPVYGMKSSDKFDFIVSNPPFNLDFSEYRDSVANNPAYSERFFAGVPSIPNKKKESMSIYLLFIQHLLYALKPNGKGAIVVPTGFITAQSSIEKTIRQKLIKNNWLKGVVSMPSNIFANTGTQVSVVFIDKSPTEQRPVFIDASKLGTQIKDGKNQRTLLSSDDEQKIINAFFNSDEEDFSIRPSIDEIAAKNYSFAAGQYFDIKIEHIPINQDEFNQKMADYKQELKQLFNQSQQLEQEILNNLEKVFLA